MFVADELIFLQLQKTGCTHISRILADILPGKQIGKHNKLTAGLAGRGSPILGSIRDPWKWYLSLWSFGCEGKGGLYRALTLDGGRGLKSLGPRSDILEVPHRILYGFSRRRRQWRACYRDVDDAHAFRDWLFMIHDPANWRDFKDGFARSPISRSCGLLTYRFVDLFCIVAGESAALRPDAGYDDIARYQAGACFISHFVRNEHLERDLLDALDEIGIAITDAQRARILVAKKTNATSRRRAYADYYDTQTARLIGERERLIVERFGYRPPGHRSPAQPARVEPGGVAAVSW